MYGNTAVTQDTEDRTWAQTGLCIRGPKAHEHCPAGSQQAGFVYCLSRDSSVSGPCWMAHTQVTLTWDVSYAELTNKDAIFF